MGKEDVIREFMPTGFHEIDKAGRPILIINAGQFKLTEIIQNVNLETVTKFIIRELEHTWREKFERCEQEVRPNVVDQIRLIIDMRSATLKQVTHKQLNLIWREIVKEVSKRFPEFVHSVHVLNAPMFFENYFMSELKPLFSERTFQKITITGESAPACLLDIIDAERLPAIYGGQCNCQAQCIYSDKGPWSTVLNVIDF